MEQVPVLKLFIQFGSVVQNFEVGWEEECEIGKCLILIQSLLTRQKSISAEIIPKSDNMIKLECFEVFPMCFIAF